MTPLERDERLAIVAACAGRSPTRLSALLRRLDAAAVPGGWRVGANAQAGWTLVGLQFIGDSTRFELIWDMAADKAVMAPRAAAAGSRPSAFDPARFTEPETRRIFSNLLALHPDIEMIGGSSQWSLLFPRGLPWPLFLGLDVAAPFARASAQTAFFHRNHAVRELVFRGGELWAYGE